MISRAGALQPPASQQRTHDEPLCSLLKNSPREPSRLLQAIVDLLPVSHAEDHYLHFALPDQVDDAIVAEAAAPKALVRPRQGLPGIRIRRNHPLDELDRSASNGRVEALEIPQAPSFERHLVHGA